METKIITPKKNWKIRAYIINVIVQQALEKSVAILKFQNQKMLKN